MIEIVYEKEKQKPEGNEGFFRIPNNIRQIGEVNGIQKIYIEDYAYTYLCRISSENSSQGQAAILLGQSNWKEGVSYLFVKSAVVLPQMEISEEHLSFTREMWNHVYEKNKKYFKEQEIVGWYLSIPGCSMELHEVICKTHLDHFGGNDKVLMVMEPLEKEEAFYRYEEGQLIRQTGFYVYYEKNEPMQNYLIAQNEKSQQKSEHVEDQAVKTFRKKVENKTEAQKQTKGISFFRTASICAMAAALAVGVLYLNDYHKLKKTEGVISALEGGDKQEQVKTEPVNGLVSEQQDLQEEPDSADKEQSGETKDAESVPGQEENVQNSPQNEAEDKNIAQTQENSSQGQNSSGIQGGNNGDAQEKGSSTQDIRQTADGVHQSYTIQLGDTITSISMRYYGSSSKINEICALNGLSPEDFIFPGQKILLP